LTQCKSCTTSTRACTAGHTAPWSLCD
jgi:hypothetical protein